MVRAARVKAWPRCSQETWFPSRNFPAGCESPLGIRLHLRVLGSGILTTSASDALYRCLFCCAVSSDTPGPNDARWPYYRSADAVGHLKMDDRLWWDRISNWVTFSKPRELPLGFSSCFWSRCNFICLYFGPDDLLEPCPCKKTLMARNILSLFFCFCCCENVSSLKGERGWPFAGDL